MSMTLLPQPLKIASSILSADFSRLGEEVAAVDNAGCDWVHIDVMDGHFVPNITIGPQVVKSIRPITRKPFDVHLMLEPYDQYLEPFAEAGADIITLHVEAGPHLNRGLQKIRHLGKKAGVALNPSTPENTLSHVLDAVDLILVMSVNPGFGGQTFIYSMLNKIANIRDMVQGRNIDIAVDGGVTVETAGLITHAGANVLIAGAALFKGGATHYQDNITAIRQGAADVS